MYDKLARTISILFHPITIPAYTFLLIFIQKSYISERLTLDLKLWLIGIVILTTILIPSFFIYFFLMRGIIKSGYMEARHERNLPYFITIIFFYVTYYLIRQMPIPMVYELFMLGATFIVAVSFIINFWWKISIHMTAIGGMLGTFTGISNIYLANTLFTLIGILIIAGIIGSSRLQLGSHRPSQIYSGFILGYIIMYAVFSIPA